MKTAFLLLLFICVNANAQVYRVSDPDNGQANCVCIGNDAEGAVFLTSGHMVLTPDRQTAYGHLFIHLTYKSNFVKMKADVVGYSFDLNKDADIALLRIPNVTATKYYAISDAPQTAYALKNSRQIKSVTYVKDSEFDAPKQICVGDSGSPVLSSDGSIVGILSGFDIQRKRQECSRRFHCHVNLCQWVRNYYPQCRSGQCITPQYRVQQIRPPMVRTQPPVVIDPPLYRVEKLPEPTPTPAPPRPEPQQIDYKKLADYLVAYHADVLRGPKGDPGAPGDSAQVDYKALANYLITNHYERLRGPKGPPGPEPSVDYVKLAKVFNDIYGADLKSGTTEYDLHKTISEFLVNNPRYFREIIEQYQKDHPAKFRYMLVDGTKEDQIKDYLRNNPVPNPSKLNSGVLSDKIIQDGGTMIIDKGNLTGVK